jgi:hypothetical protein
MTSLEMAWSLEAPHLREMIPRDNMGPENPIGESCQSETALESRIF